MKLRAQPASPPIAITAAASVGSRSWPMGAFGVLFARRVSQISRSCVSPRTFVRTSVRGYHRHASSSVICCGWFAASDSPRVESASVNDDDPRASCSSLRNGERRETKTKTRPRTHHLRRIPDGSQVPATVNRTRGEYRSFLAFFLIYDFTLADLGLSWNDVFNFTLSSPTAWT